MENEMARSKSKHVRTIMQRRKHWKQRQKRIKEAVKANGGKPLPRKPAHVKKNPPLPPPPARRSRRRRPQRRQRRP